MDEKTIERIKTIITTDRLLKKHLYKDIWLSGSSTMVYPITIWKHRVDIQLDTSKNVFTKCIERIVNANKDLFKCGIFSKNDGSCPSELIFFLN